MAMGLNMSFYKGKRILVTGHTGFKGSWLCRILMNAGADVTGYALEPSTNPNLYCMAELKNVNSVIGDIRDYKCLKDVFDKIQPEIVIHMAAQPIVRESYQKPRYTYEINVMGTVNLFECVRLSNCVKSVLNITTDKVYKNNEWCWGYRENEMLDGFDPYSNSKSCSELVTHSYINSFLKDRGIAVSTARAGNVIGGGDFAKDRIIPDCIRAVQNHMPIKVRNPYSIRPYQYVLDPLAAYLEIIEKQYSDIAFADSYNVGPDESDCISTEELVALFCKHWNRDVQWENLAEGNSLHEADCLKLDCNKIKKVLGWKPRWNIEEAIKRVCDFNKAWLDGECISREMDKEINEFFDL